MKIMYAPIDVVLLDAQFFEDLERYPAVQERVNTLLLKIDELGKFPASFQPHKANGYEVWIGYINLGRGGFRVLFTYDEGEVIFKRMLTHDEMMRELR